MNPKKLILLFFSLFQAVALAEDPGSAYIKNSGTDSMHVWVNGSYQGYVRPGETRYSVSDGFITSDSGNGHDSKPVKESHGGWENNSHEKVTVTYQFADGQKKTMEVSVNERGEAIFGATNKEGAEPEVPTDLERECQSDRQR